jgi:hypothetical protein
MCNLADRHLSLLLSKFELLTAFHAILGTSLFLFGNLIAQESSLALGGESTNPVLYWLTALNVFEMGENLPSRTSGTGYSDDPEDWRMAIIWGRTLVCLADDLANRQIQARQQGEDPYGVYLDLEEPNWPRGSPFHAKAAQRHPIMQRMSFRVLHDLETSAVLDGLERERDALERPPNFSRYCGQCLEERWAMWRGLVGGKRGDDMG